MSQNYNWPSSSTVTVAAVGPNNIAIPTSSILIGGEDGGGILRPVAVDSDGVLQISEISPITGFALESTQLLVKADLDAINTHIPQLTLGSQLAAASLSVVLASNGTVPLPTGAATEATLAAMSAKLPTALGSQLIAASLAVNIASNQTVSVSAVSLPLPSGAATSANQATEITSLSSIDGKLPATLGQKAMAASMAVVVASDQSAIPVSVASLPLPSGAATAANQATEIASLASIDGKVSTSAKQDTGNTSLASVDGKLANAYGSAAGALRTAAQIGNASAVADFNAGVTGAQTLRVSANILRDGTALSYNLGASDANSLRVAANVGFAGTAASVSSGATDSGTQRVILASNSPGVAGKAFSNAQVYNDYSSVNVTTAAYVQLVASTTSATNLLQVFDSSGQTMIIAVGAAASEIDQCYIFPGGQGDIPLAIPAGSRVSVKAKTASATSGYLAINLFT